MAPQQNMPQVGIKFYLLIVAASFYSNAAELLIPFLLGRPAKLVEIPVFAFRSQVACCIFNTGIGDRNFQLNRFPRLYMVLGRYSRGWSIIIAHRPAVFCPFLRPSG